MPKPVMPRLPDKLTNACAARRLKNDPKKFPPLLKVYDPSEGTMIDMLKGHRDTVYCLSYECAGKIR